MSSMITDKFRKLFQTKEAIRCAIEEKGVSCSEDLAFADYPDRIRRIEGLGSGDSEKLSLCFCQLGEITTLFSNMYCVNNEKSDGVIRYYEGSGSVESECLFASVKKLGITVAE